jgi:hypothetical protein
MGMRFAAVPMSDSVASAPAQVMFGDDAGPARVCHRASEANRQQPRSGIDIGGRV